MDVEEARVRLGMNATTEQERSNSLFACTRCSELAHKHKPPKKKKKIGLCTCTDLIRGKRKREGAEISNDAIFGVLNFRPVHWCSTKKVEGAWSTLFIEK